MSYRGGYIFKHFEGSAEPLLRDFPGEIKTDGATDRTPLPDLRQDPWLLDRVEILDWFHRSGCSELFRENFDTPGDCDRIKNIIIGAVYNSPLNHTWKPEILNDRVLLIDGLRMIHKLFPAAKVSIAVNGRNRKWFDALELDSLAAVRVMSDRYPQEFPELLKRDLAPGNGGASPAVVVSFEDALLTAECLTRGRTLRDRILVVAGPGVSRPGWYRIPVGARFAEIRRLLLRSEAQGPWRIIRGSLLSGKAVASDAEVVSGEDREITVIREHAVRDFYRFLNPGFDYDSYSRVTVSSYVPLFKRRLDSNTHGGVRPCVQCNFCDEVCPVGLYPHQIWKRMHAGMPEESSRFRPERCIGCGLCDYVCPSKIEVAGAVRQAGDAVREGRTA